MKEITITEQHLDKAIAERPDGYEHSYSITKQCVFAQAVREAGYPDATTSAAGVYDPDGMTVFAPVAPESADALRQLVTRFDGFDYKGVRRMLPLTIQLEEPNVRQ